MDWRLKPCLLAGASLCCPGLAAAVAENCFTSPEAAARDRVGTSVREHAEQKNGGFRAEDLLIDATLRRVWIRVRQCGEPAGPLLLIPVGDAGTTVRLGETLASSRAASHAAHLPAIHVGESLRISMQTDTARITLEATAEMNATVGEELRVRLKKDRGDSGEAKVLNARLISAAYAEVMP